MRPYDYDRRITLASESSQIAKEINELLSDIEKLRQQASKAENNGQLGRADGLRSKIRTLSQKLDLAHSDYAAALHREEPMDKQAGWLNAVNGTYFSLYWDKSKFLIEEMPDGSPIPATMSLTEKSNFDRYQLPVLDKVFKKYELLYVISLDATTARRASGLHVEDSGPTARHKLIEGTKSVLQEVLRNLEDEVDKYPQARERLEAYKRLLPDLERKLVWKKLK